MNYTFFAQTDAGLVRSNNEDAVCFDANHQVLVLADGMGGYNAGEVASGIAITYIKSELVRWLASETAPVDAARVSRAIENCVSRANLSILNAATSNPAYAGMGTTLVVGVFLGDTLVLGHVGDSRCYRWRGGELAQLTKDHSMLQEQVDAGVLTPQQAAIAPGKNLLTRALGVEEAVRVDVATHGVNMGDLYLMCSDGLSDMLDAPSIGEMLAAGHDLPELAALLVDGAKARGGRDNITVLLAQAGSSPTGLMARLFGKP